ncbi:DUF7089 family protein [Natronorarus salvus]|uniref:DUF7089 family protein n=1 Tax=Natronorarus salvus TaxID=3117733 RepID=UPI002F2613EB
MFRERGLNDELEAVRAAHAPETLVLDCEADFESLPPEALDELALVTRELHPVSYPTEWLPERTPDPLRRFAGSDLVIGLPEGGSVIWTRQTEPPLCLVKARVQGAPEGFVDFLVANALVEVGLELPESFLGFFGERYTDLVEALAFSPASSYQVAAALYQGWIGLHTRETFAGWADEFRTLHDEWVDAGERLEPRLDDLSTEVATGETDFAEATEYACGAIRHDLDLPTPFSALDTEAYREYGAEYAVRWAEKTVAALGEGT